jgi:adenosylcobinamide-GDP ribazoletransferase
MRPQDIVDDLARSVGFLSRLAVPARFFDGHDGSLGRAVRMFPLAGLVIALPAAAFVFMLSSMQASTALTALLALLATVAVTGALHEDGLADCADAFLSGRPRERILEILKDSNIGVYGALALVFSVALRAVALTILIAACPPALAGFVVLAAAAWSRATMVWHWSDLPPARSHGVAASVGAPEAGTVGIALATGAAAALLAAWLVAGGVAALVAAGLSLGGVYLWTTYVRSRLGGHTGDTIGAAQQLCETAFLVLLALSL